MLPEINHLLIIKVITIIVTVVTAMTVKTANKLPIITAVIDVPPVHVISILWNLKLKTNMKSVGNHK